MNTQTNQKTKFPLGAVILAIIGLYSIISLFRGGFSSDLDYLIHTIISMVSNLCIILPTLIILIKKKKEKVIAVPFIIYTAVQFIYMFYKAANGSTSIADLIWTTVEICAFLMCVYSSAMPEKATKHYHGSVCLISLIFCTAMFLNVVFNLGTYFGIFDAIFPIGIFLCTMWLLNPYTRSDMTTKEKISEITKSLKVNFSEKSTKVALIIIAIAIIAIVSLVISKDTPKCQYKENGVSVCDQPCADKNSNFCHYHEKYLMDAYEDVKDRYDTLTGQK